MYDMNRRLNKAENKLNLDKEQIVVRITTYGDKKGFDLSNLPEQWLTYPEALERAPKQNGVIVLHEDEEITARRKARLSNSGG